MAIASLALRTSNVTINNASVEIRTTAGVAVQLLELSLIQVTGTASSYGFGTPAALGVTPGTTSTFQRDNATAFPACVTTASLTWGTSPTAPTNYRRRTNTAATIGVGIVWTFPRGLYIPVSSSVVIFNITATVALDVNMVIDE
jgi:hypothetical protein